MNPKARTEGLTIQAVADEQIVYDKKRNRAHHLNTTAARVWQLCDGATSEEEMARRLAEEINTSVDKALVQFTIAELGRARLLETTSVVPKGVSSVSRRQFMRQTAMAALALPIITSMVAPSPVQAQGGDEGPKDPDQCTGDHYLRLSVVVMGLGKGCEEARKEAKKKVEAFTDQKCGNRKCPKAGKCLQSDALIDDGFCRQEGKEGKTVSWIYTVFAYRCGCK